MEQFDETLISILESLLGNNYDSVRSTVCLQNAIMAVSVYVNKDVKAVAELYPCQIAQLAFYYYKSFDDMNIQSKSQGNRSVTYAAKGIPDDIKKSLPRYIRPIK